MKPDFKLPEGVLIDEEDIPKISKYSWHIASNGYVTSDQRDRKNKTGKVVRLHRHLMDFPNESIDHINQNKLDNRKENLRLCDNSTNALNRGAQSNSKSGYKGISWCKQKNKWRVAANLKGKQHHLGFYTTLETAIEAWNNKIESIHGEWAVKQ